MDGLHGKAWGEDWPCVLSIVQNRTLAKARRMGLGAHVAEEAVQHATLRLLEQSKQGLIVRAPARWLLRVAGNLLIDVIRGRCGPIGQGRDRQPAAGVPLAEMCSEVSAGPARSAALKDLWAQAPRLFKRLPPPYRHVAKLQFIDGCTREQIFDWLQAWGAVSRSTCPGILRRTHEMLPSLAGTADPRSLWPQRYHPNKNAWILLPPPPLCVSSGRGPL